MLYVWVALGGALGSLARLGLSQAIFRLLGGGFPYGILIVNVLGCFAMGLVTAALARKTDGNQAAQYFLTTGMLGGFTTFSAFSLDVLKLINGGQAASATVYVLASVGLSIVAVFVGFALMSVTSG
jgi:fluoride exporter